MLDPHPCPSFLVPLHLFYRWHTTVFTTLALLDSTSYSQQQKVCLCLSDCQSVSLPGRTIWHNSAIDAKRGVCSDGRHPMPKLSTSEHPLKNQASLTVVVIECKCQLNSKVREIQKMLLGASRQSQGLGRNFWSMCICSRKIELEGRIEVPQRGDGVYARSHSACRDRERVKGDVFCLCQEL